MPKYDYICNKKECKTKTFEVITQTFKEEKQICPDCKEKTMDRKSVYQFSFTGF